MKALDGWGFVFTEPQQQGLFRCQQLLGLVFTLLTSSFRRCNPQRIEEGMWM